MTFAADSKTVSRELKDKETITLGSAPECTFVATGDCILEIHLKIYKENNDYVVEVMQDSESKKKVARVWRLLHQNEQYILFPEDVIKTGKISLMVQRFNVGIIADIGTRAIMEDFNKIIHDLKISESVHCSYYGVYDGHGGESVSYTHLTLPTILRV